MLPYLALTLIAVVSFVIGVKGLRSAMLLRRRGIRTTGVVVGFQRVASGGTTPVVTFVDAEGRKVQITSTGSGPGVSLRPGVEVPVLYLAERPQTAIVATRGQRVAATVLPFLITAAALVMIALILPGGTSGN